MLCNFNTFLKNLTTCDMNEAETSTCKLYYLHLHSQWVGIHVMDKNLIYKRYENPLTFLFPIQLEINSTDYFGNNIRISQFHTRQELQELRLKVNRGEWEMTPPQVNAYYSPPKNEIGQSMQTLLLKARLNPSSVSNLKLPEFIVCSLPPPFYRSY